ncbi:50S ribosomal protein L11 methyltransferase [Anaerotalea alkaliphila]|uniref:Ribosomal protein L11 methyltransferase n=1 Tax=Anaerotalea alkaliphila TaxID=2662126 RepID=A0A7X5HX20_9FIRM|nr:50S ribosomal protein L11 methyltransferase [Anaerotalea alkaliphila]NDL68215.1 50S ribosomal protein L11 methyltransferase [Anaerotalea alkaliphila]
MEWNTITLSVDDEAVDQVSQYLVELGVLGVEILDYVITDEERTQLFVDYMDEQPPLGKETRLRFYISKEDDLEGKLQLLQLELLRLSEFMDVGSCALDFGTTQEEDWANNWKQHYKPFKVGERIWVKPLWETLPEEGKGQMVLDIDPGMAFGSGTHETTAMCIALLEKYLEPGQSVVDVGCGSGILGLAAAKLGAAETLCIDLDPNAVIVAKENVAHNGLSDKVRVVQGNLIDQVEAPADLLVANIMAEVVAFLTGDVAKVIKDGGLYITSGIILKKVDLVKEALRINGFTLVEVRTQGDWAALVAKKDPR